MKFKNLLVTSVIALTASCWAETAKAFTLIDDYDAPNTQFFTDDNFGGNIVRQQSSLTSGSGILGTVRDIEIFTTNSGTLFTTGTASTGAAAANRLSFQKNDGTSNVDFRVDYDGTSGFGSGLGFVDGTAVDGLGGINFTQGDPNLIGIAFRINNFNDLQAGSLASLTVFSNSGANVGTSNAIDVSTLNPAVDDLVFLFTNSGFTANSVNFANVGALRLDFTLVNTSFQPAAIRFDQVEIAQVPFEFSPFLGVSILGGLYGLNRIRKNKIKAVK